MRLSQLLPILPLLVSIPVQAQTDQEHPCYKYELIICRGSDEPSPLGVSLGPNTKATIEPILGDDILAIGLIYPATFELPYSPETGIRNLVARIQARAEQCPDMKFALTGFSQGADVVHHSLQELADVQDRIVGIATFGDPLTSIGFPPVYEGRAYNTCDKLDRSCGGEGIDGHSAYGDDPEAYEPAVDFLVERLEEEKSPEPTDSTETMAELPSAGDAAAFLDLQVEWPPADWAQKYPDGWVAEPVFVG
ncbi:hypothetical protein FQN54_003652 [Arachnomyces sp. PD_36]|nr:hypothetical protein FQN54_003652 [Arachnomyces sp. PD_36]